EARPEDPLPPIVPRPDRAGAAPACPAPAASRAPPRPAPRCRTRRARPGSARSGRRLRRLQHLGAPLDLVQRVLRQPRDLLENIRRCVGIQITGLQPLSQLLDASRQARQRVVAHVPTPSVLAIRPRIPWPSAAASGAAYRLARVTASSIATAAGVSPPPISQTASRRMFRSRTAIRSLVHPSVAASMVRSSRARSFHTPSA